MGLVDKIKNDVKKSGSNKGKLVYIREGVKCRVRFLTDMDDGMEIKFHDSYAKSITVPCQEVFGRPCKYCDDEELRTRSQYAWSVWDYEAKEVKLFMFPVNNCSPVPALMAMYENYGTLTDRDYIITVTGKQTEKSYSVVPMDKVRFRNEKAKPLSESAILKILDKAFPCDDEEEEDEDDYSSKKRSSKPSAKAKAAKRRDEEEEDWEDEGDADDYSSMTPKELYALCKERSIKAAPKKPAKYYINLLEEYDAAQDDWGDEEEEDEDDWEDE